MGIIILLPITYREDWKPVLTINSIIYGLQFLFLEPNPDDPLNKGPCNNFFVLAYSHWCFNLTQMQQKFFVKTAVFLNRM